MVLLSVVCPSTLPSAGGGSINDYPKNDKQTTIAQLTTLKALTSRIAATCIRSNYKIIKLKAASMKYR